MVAGVRTELLAQWPAESLMVLLQSLEKKLHLLHIREQELALAQQMKNPALNAEERTALMKRQTELLNQKKLLTARS